MKILVATGIYPPSIGGPATHAKLVETELPKYGIDVDVLSFDSVRYLPKIIRHIVYIWKLLKSSKKCELIYALDPVSVGLPALFVSKVLRKRMILRIGGDYAWEQATSRFNILDDLDDFTEKKYNSISIRFMKYIQFFVAKNCTKIIAPSFYLKKIILKWGILEGKIDVIYNFAPDIFIVEDKNSLRKKLNLTGKVILSSGRLIKLKGFEKLIEAFSIMPSDYKLFIIGSGPLKVKIGGQIESLKLHDRIKIIDALDREKLFEYIKAADVFILNTAAEGFSNILLETMAIGTPVIATAKGGNIELITQNFDGLLIEHDNIEEIQQSIEFIFDNPEIRQKYIDNAKNSVSKFTKEDSIKKIISIFNQTLL